jgi:hypothetical protein
MVRTSALITGLILLLSFGSILAQDTAQDLLPDDFLIFTLKKVDNRFEGANEYLEGFRITIILPKDTLQADLDSERLMLLIRNRAITGVLTYPNGKSTSIDFEVVGHRGRDDIYMKTTLGYFLWESYGVREDEITFVIYWWYCPPASEADLQVLEMVESLLADSSSWHQYDDRKCDNDIENGIWSLFCALKYASVSIMDEYNHHNTAMQSVRSVIDEMVPNHGFAHTLMDFNNAPSTNHSDIVRILAKAKDRIRQELRRNGEY